jgi:hypothetical protein
MELIIHILSFLYRLISFGFVVTVYSGEKCMFQYSVKFVVGYVLDT